MAKRDSYENDDDFLDEEIADWDEDEESAGDAEDEGAADDDADDDSDDADDADDADDDAGDEEETRTSEAAQSDNDADDVRDEVEETPVEEEIVYPPDDEKALAALRKMRVRLDVNEKGNVWRAIFDDTNGKDPSLVLLKGLPALKELWLLGTKVTPTAAESFKTEHPKIKVYA